MTLVLVVIVGMLAGSGTPAAGATRWWTPSARLTWDIQLAVEPEAALVLPAGPIAALGLDGEETRAETVAAVHAQGISALCYINVGAWEEWRPDAGSYPAAILGKSYPGWPGERFVDIRAMDVLGPIIRARFDDCARKGFDAIEPDNIDTAYSDTGYSLTETDQRAFNLWLADEAHARGLAIFQKNVPELTADLVDTYDGAVTEDCVADGWCAEMTPYFEANKPVLAIEYTDVTDGDAFGGICARPDLAKFSLILKNRELDAFRISCGERIRGSMSRSSRAWRVRRHSPRIVRVAVATGKGRVSMQWQPGACPEQSEGICLPVQGDGPIAVLRRRCPMPLTDAVAWARLRLPQLDGGAAGSGRRTVTHLATTQVRMMRDAKMMERRDTR